MKKSLYISLALIAFPLFTSCNDDDDKGKDTQGPKITLYTPADGQHMHKGDELIVKFQLADESGIQSYKLDIHSAAGHTHEHDDHVHTRAEELKNWSYQKVYTDMKGQKEADVQLDLGKVPTDIKGGDYHLGVLATDSFGNETQHFITIEVK